jgi:hypothetical protein
MVAVGGGETTYCPCPNIEGRGPNIEGRGPNIEGRGPNIEGRGPNIEGREILSSCDRVNVEKRI